jgi:hypothetical protein
VYQYGGSGLVWICSGQNTGRAAGPQPADDPPDQAGIVGDAVQHKTADDQVG